MLLYGASGYAKVVIDSLASMEKEVTSIFDDDLNKKELLDIPVVGGYIASEQIIISVGDNKTRKKISSTVKHKFGKAVHKSAIISENVKIIFLTFYIALFGKGVTH